MNVVLISLRCSPADSFNPFHALQLTPVVCTLLLAGAAVAVWLLPAVAPRSDRRGMSRFVPTIVLIAVCVSLLLTAWVWVQSLLFVGSCGGFWPDWRYAEQRFAVDTLSAANQVMRIGTLLVLLVAALYVLFRVLSGSRSRATRS